MHGWLLISFGIVAIFFHFNKYVNVSIVSISKFDVVIRMKVVINALKPRWNWWKFHEIFKFDGYMKLQFEFTKAFY